MLKIVKATDPLPVEQLVLCLYGPPGLGKSTLGYTAADTLLLDYDKGAHRAAHRGDTVAVHSWKDTEQIQAADLVKYKTIVLDTAGRSLDFLTADIIAANPKLGRGGALTLQGFGELKARFGAYLKFLRTLGKDVVLVAHMDEQRNGDDVIERLDVQGGSKGEIYKSADAMGRITIRNGQRFIDFNPRENSFGKNPCGLPILPFSLDDKNCLADIIRTIKERLNQGVVAQPAAEPKKAAPAKPPAAKPNGATSKAFDDGSQVRGVIENVICRDDNDKWLKAKNGNAYVKVNVAGQTYYAFDNVERVILNGGEHRLKLFGLLAEAKANDAIDFTYEVSKKGGRSIKEVTRLGMNEWESGTGLPVIQRGAQVNPEVTDADLPF